jgi:hypothetical protein
MQPLENPGPGGAPALPGRPELQLLRFALGLALLLGALEVLVRRNIPLFEGASHRMLAKVAMFGEQRRVDFLFFGTSRTQDGLAPRLVCRHLAELSPEFKELAGFNAASTGSNYEDLLTVAPRYLQRPGLRAVIIELSPPHLSNPSSLPPVVEAETTAPDRLARALKQVALIRYRTAFLTDNLGRLPALLCFSSRLSGCETRGSEQLAAVLGWPESSPQGFDAQLWEPTVIVAPGKPTPLSPELETAAGQITALAQTYTEQGIRVIFSVPPLTARHQPAPERDTLKPLFSEVARRTGCEVWDFAAQPRPDKFFKDSSHLTRKDGRAHWSYALAQQLARPTGKR